MRTKGEAPARRTRTRIQIRNEALILDAALEVFSALGFHGATIERIADGAGMSKANVLYYFRRKRDIHSAVLERTLALWLEPLERLDPEGEPIEEIARYARVKLRLSREAPEASRLFANEMLQGAETVRPLLDEKFRELVDRKCGVLQRWIDEGRLAPVEPLHLLFLIWATTQHYADFAPQIEVLHDGDDDALHDGAGRTLQRLLTGGLAPDTAPAADRSPSTVVAAGRTVTDAASGEGATVPGEGGDGRDARTTPSRAPRRTPRRKPSLS